MSLAGTSSGRGSRAALLLLAGIATSCIGVSAQRRNPDGSLAPPRYCATGVRVAADGLIDDFEDGNTRTAVIDGRGGYWYKSADAAGSTIGPDDFVPRSSGPGQSMAMQAVGETTTGDASEAWGAQFGASFMQTGSYDASKYVGIRFRIRGSKGTAGTVRFKLSDENTHPNYGKCTACWNHFGRDVALGEEWREYEFFFSSLEQAPYWGDPRPASVNHQKLHGFDFAVPQGNKFDFWVDDMAFIECK